MGNEQGSPYLQQKQQQSPNSGTSSPYDFESLIVIRGERRTGKTTLVSRMKGQSFNPNYSPTPSLEVFQFPWKLNSSHCNNVMISIWDVVEHSIPKEPASRQQPTSNSVNNTDEPRNTLPDAQSIDTLKRANGLVIMIDQRNGSSIDLAEKLICEAPEECQIVVFSNFYGEGKVTPLIPLKLRPHVGRFSFILGNLKTNLGLVALSKWLQLPLLSAKRKMFADLFRAADNDLHSLEDEFYKDASDYLSMQTAMSKIPPVKVSSMQHYSNVDAMNDSSISPSDSNISPSGSQPSKLERPSVFAEPIVRTKRKPMPFCNNTGPPSSFDTEQNNRSDDGAGIDEGFWSDDDDNGDSLISKESLSSAGQPDKERLRPNPMVQAAQSKKTMLQVIQESTVRKVPSSSDKSVVSSAQQHKLKRKKKSGASGGQIDPQKVGIGDVNEKFFSDDDDKNGDDVNDTTSNSKPLNLKQNIEFDPAQKNSLDLAVKDKVEPNMNSNSSGSTVLSSSRPKAVFTTTLVIEEEDEEDEVESNKPNDFFNGHSNNALSQQETVENTVIESSNKEDSKQTKNDENENEEGFWSDNEDEVNKNDNNDQNGSEAKLNGGQINQDDDDNELLARPNPLVQKVKPRTNQYKNIVPLKKDEADVNNLNDEKVAGNSINELKINQNDVNVEKVTADSTTELKSIQTDAKEAVILNDESTHENANQTASKIDNNESPQQQPSSIQLSSSVAADDDDDFWNFSPSDASNKQVIADAIEKKRRQRIVKKKKSNDGQQQSPLSAPLNKERPLVIPKSQVHQRTITVQSSKISYEQKQQQQQAINMQNPVIPTTDLFSDLADSKNDDFFKPQSVPYQKSTQKVEVPTTKTTRKRKRIVKSANNNNNGHSSVPGYDSV